jgi:hypothetical protein
MVGDSQLNLGYRLAISDYRWLSVKVDIGRGWRGRDYSVDLDIGCKIVIKEILKEKGLRM